MMERRAVGGSLGADIIAVAVEANDAGCTGLPRCDGVLAERQGFYLAGADGDEERDPGEVAEILCSVLRRGPRGRGG